MKILNKVHIGLGIMGMSCNCFAQVYAGYSDIPAEGVGYATEVVSYTPGLGVAAPQNISSNTLGEPDVLTTSLGRGGSIVVSLSPLSLIGDNTSAADFYIYEHKLYNSWDTYISDNNESWIKIESDFSSNNDIGVVKGYDVDKAKLASYHYIKIVDTSNESGSKSAGADVDAIVLANAVSSEQSTVIDTDSRNSLVFNLEQNKNNQSIGVKIINNANSVKYINYSSDGSLIPIALSVQGDFNCDDIKDINVLAIRKKDGVAINIIKDVNGNSIRVIDNSLGD
ncbi:MULTISPECIES: cell envelope biogenesis protein OmpA [Pseudescherichia]|uniref:cell envelope biogenesis protein OmpA n=1 Tax=Pseudescherichia TaxID=2055880 RepID=UPI001EE121B0|nr:MULTISPECIES: cell envelope biogenesis protein OmpA [Pseudescherichia]